MNLEPCACGGTAKLYKGINWSVYCSGGVCEAAVKYQTKELAIATWNAPALLAKSEAENARLRGALSVIQTMPLTGQDSMISANMRYVARAALGDTP